MNSIIVNIAFDTYAMLIVNIGVVLLAGMIVGKISEYLHLPEITGYLIAGLILGPVTGFISMEEINHMNIISDVALGFIAFQVGNELWLGKLKKTGFRIILITVVQAVFTTMVVAFLLSFVTDISTALVLGAIAAATAPAPIMMLISKYNAKGPLTDTIVPIVGLDDAVGVILFGTLLSLSVSLLSDSSTVHLLQIIKEPVIEIMISLGLGSIIGVLSGVSTKILVHKDNPRINQLDVVVITVFVSVGLAMLFHASSILTPMIAGAFVTNLINKDTYVLEEQTIRFFIPPLMILFFTLSGAALSFSTIMTVGLIGIVYIIGRIIGKFGGAFIGSKLTKMEGPVKRYLGIAMLPQSGVAIGLAMAATKALEPINPSMADMIHNVTLASVLVFALSGPILVKLALSKAKEIL